MNLDFWAATDVGITRDHNEDNFLVDRKLRVFVVADGMGGHASGEVASSMCVRKVQEVVSDNQDLIQKYLDKADGVGRSDLLHMLEHAVQEACSTIYERAQRESEKRGMGTTCSVLMLVEERGLIAHVGDSRIYLMRQGQVHQLSDDHSLINELIKRGSLKAEEVDDSPYKDYKNAVTRAVGVYESVAVDTLDFDVLPGDQFLLCSDGLHHYLDDERIIRTLQLPKIKSVPEAFIQMANDGGGHDNITSVVVRIPGGEEPDLRSKDLTNRMSALQGMPIFRYLSYKELVRVLNITQVQKYTDAEVICEEGSKGEDMYIILDGQVEIRIKDSHIASLAAGDHFGEMALLDSAPRSATALATGKARLLILKRSDFYRLIRHETKLSVRLLWSFLQVLTERLRNTSAELSEVRNEGLGIPDLGELEIGDDMNTLPLSDNMSTLPIEHQPTMPGQMDPPKKKKGK